MADKIQVENSVRLELTREEKQSSAWVKVEKYLERRLQQLRIQNDGDKSPEATALLRGRIAEVKKLLADDSNRFPAAGAEQP